MRLYVIIFLIVILVFVTYFTDFFFPKKNPLNETLALKEENEALLAQIQRYSLSGSRQPDFSGEKSLLKARVFSTYPFNTKNLLTIDAGENQGVKNALTVTLDGSILIGQVKEVGSKTSIVQTIFDPNLQLPVRIGEKQIDGLFQGGSEPKVILVEKTKPVSVGDFVYSAGSAFPYGLKIGEISEIKENAAGVFKEMNLKIPFNVVELREVSLILSR